MHVMEYSVMFYIEMVFREPIAILLFLGDHDHALRRNSRWSLCCCCPISGFLIARISKSLKRKSTRVQEKSADLLRSGGRDPHRASE